MVKPNNDANPYAPPRGDAAPVADGPKRRAVDWRKVRWAAGIWLGFIATLWLSAGAMHLATTDPEVPPPIWLMITLGILAIGVGVGFVIYNLILLVGILSGRFRKS